MHRRYNETLSITLRYSGSFMPADDILLDCEDRMEKAIANLKNQLVGIRTAVDQTRIRPPAIDLDGSHKIRARDRRTLGGSDYLRGI